MDPERYYKYSDFGTIDQHIGAAPVEQPEEADATKPAMVYMLSQLSEKRPGPVLIVGFGTPLKNAVRAATNFGVRPIFTTGTGDKLRAFSFGGLAQVVPLGPKFDERLFTNEFAILEAAENMGAKTILWSLRESPSNLLCSEIQRRGLFMLTPHEGDRALLMWANATAESPEIPPAQWCKCAHCGLTHDKACVQQNEWKCPSCKKLYRIDSAERIAITFDKDSFQEIDADLAETNPLDFPEFDTIIERARKRSGKNEGVCCGIASIKGVSVAVGIMETTFMMGSMGHVVGEKLTRMIERATEEKLPVVIFCASGGARMQEGLASLMQMAKVSAAIEAHSRAGLLFVSIITDPTTGGVTASFATLGDIILAEPQALMGFAGRRVIQDTIKQTLPEDFQSAEFALEHGLIDAIVERTDMRDKLANILSLHGYASTAYASTAETESTTTCIEESFEDLNAAEQVNTKTSEEYIKDTSSFAALKNSLSGLAGSLGHVLSEQTSAAGMWWAIRNKGVADLPNMKPATSNINLPVRGAKPAESSNRAWESVQLARNAKRPTSMYYIESMVKDFIELHGDRAFGDDGAIVGGIGRINGREVTVIAQEKGPDLRSRIARNFGCPQPEGYRKAQRLMQQAQKFGRPIVCLVDTQGAFCGREAEEHGIGNSISESLALMSGLTVPVVTVVLGEGGSGGALALAVANRVAMQENAVYSVLSPEGFASILWKDGSRAPEAAEVMKMSAADALAMGVIEDVIPEGAQAAHENPDQAAAAVWVYITAALDELCAMAPEELREQRYSRFRSF
ncbi:acetyl-CoA carboxylase carboxyltransferase subunit alpha [Adlercreutzia sp. ZJ154]|uniref:acetyl-CoA carboxylase carboxyltransferase subunit alpha n=1 Tax=Adlercreutzia sp. ZJ154 TaxID=2709790 RepID=UPI001F155A19|nr:acetyl-CoA carboxylase carboxyltransferase subunit alpha [Adlercreutzia sp. ZJ154]